MHLVPHMKQIELHDGTLAVEEAGHGQPLLCVHGFPLDHSMWSMQLGDLSDEFRVITPDLRGFGASSMVDDDVLTMERMANDLNDLLDRLAVDQPTVLCGLSMGGYIAWHYWRQHRDRLTALILCDTRAAADLPQVATARHYLAERVLREGTRQASQEMVQKLFAPSSRDARQPFVNDMLHVMTRTAPETIAAALRGMAQRPDVTGWLADIQCPVLVLCGEHDQMTTSEEMRDMAAAIPCAEFQCIPEAGHLAPLENPQTVNDAIRRFMRRLASRV